MSARAPGRALVAPANHPLERAADQAAARATAPRTPNAATRAPHPSRSAPGTAGALPAPRLVDDVLARSGQTLDAGTRAEFEPRLGRDLSGVRVHHDDLAARSAASIGARAFNSGPHIVFGRGQWQPHSSGGRQLLAHELAHHTDAAASSGTPLIWRKALDTSDFDAGNFGDPVLLAYLQKLRDTGAIEDARDSDDKARGVVRRWREGGDDYTLEPQIKVLLVREMQSGFTGDDDERAILQLLQHSARPDVESMFGPGQLDPDDLDDDFHGDEEDALRAIYDQVFVGGRKAAMKGGAAFTGEAEPALPGAYSHADMLAMVAERMKRIALVVRDRVQSDRDELATRLVRVEAAKMQTLIGALPPDQRDAAAQDLAGDRVQRDSQARALDADIGKAATPVQAEILQRKQRMLQTEVLLLDLAMQTGFKDLAMAAPAAPADFQKLSTPLDAAKKKAAQEAITPMTTAEVQAEATGAVAPPPAVFNPGPLTGEKDVYEDKIKARIPDIINEMHAALAAQRTKKEHDDPTLTRSMDDMQAVANQAKDEVDLVFGSFYARKDFKAFQGDKRNKAGVLTRKGNLRDVWQVEEDRRKASGGYKAASAKFWLFYLVQNDDAVKAINLAHDASPSFDEATRPLNDEAKRIRKVADPFLVSDRTRLFEIGRGWDAFAQDKDIFIQLFKKPDAQQDRIFMWDMYFTLMHEYLHKLAARKYHDYADKLGGEHSTEGNTLIEGVDSLLTEITWASAVGRASLVDIRNKVEPDAVAAGKPFDPDLLPAMPHRRYDTYEHAVRLVSVVGIRNLYAAYFQGRIDLIGGA